MFVFFFFFFSSRRRHTRSLRDWSSDVCSSDLDVNVGIQYISSWLRGNGAAGIYGLMEDAATAEIARGQVWQWVHRGAELDDGRTITAELVRELEDAEL